MTHRPIKTLADGTRLYADYSRYTPLRPEERQNRVLKPSNPDAVRFHAKWFLPLEVLRDAARAMPETRPDTDAYDHMEETVLCRCQVCIRPEAERWRRKWRREHGWPDPSRQKKNRADLGG